MNRKEIFEKVKKHLLTQRQRSVGTNGCMYRGRDGLKCAIGCLITDECYKPSLEVRSADAIEVLRALECSGIKLGDGDGYFLRNLQGIHDNWCPEAWPEALASFAKEYNL